MVTIPGRGAAGDGAAPCVEQLPSLLVLTDRLACRSRGRSVVETVELAVAAGATTVVLREKDLPRADRGRLARDVREVVPVLIVASDVALALDVGADGVHLAASDPWPDLDATAGADGAALSFLVGRSCHSRADVERSAREEAAYATLSPIFPTASKPGYGPALGPDALGGHPLPVFGLGGIGPGRIGPCIASGAAGVAVMGAVMGAEDPDHVVADVLDEADRASTGKRRGDDAPDDRRVPAGRSGHVGTHRSMGEGTG